jgi:GNAT superfamily N-acetyltransferase
MFTLDHVVPWGRSFDEYRRMFALTDDDLRGHILGCADGPASFNADATARGLRVVSCDPLYQFDAAAIRTRIDATAPEVLEQTRRNADDFLWDEIGSIDELRTLRMGAMNTFLRDFEARPSPARYVAGALPRLPFASGAFDIALVSHFLFLYSDQFDASFHVDAVVELCRVAREVRVFPLVMLGGRPSPHLQQVTRALADRGCHAQAERVPYEFQRGGNQMLRVTSEARVAVRPMRRRDLGDVARLCAQLGYSSAPAQVEARLARLQASGDAAFLIAEEGGAVLGWIHLYVYTTLESDPCVEVGGVVVDESARGRGVGRLLMIEAERWARLRSCSHVRLRSNAVRTDAHAFYERLGYRKVKTQFRFEKETNADREDA